MSRAPVFDFTYNGRPLSEMNIRHLIESVEFTESIDKFDVVKLVVNEGPALARATDLTKHGSVLQLSMGYHNEGIYPMTIVFMNSIEPDFANQKVTFTFMGYLKAMDVNERDRTLQGKSILEIVTEVLSDYPILEIGTIESGDVILSDTTTQSKQTDLSLLEGISSKFGLKWKIEPGSSEGKWALSLYKLEYDKSKAANLLPFHAFPTKAYQDETASVKLKNFRPKSNILGVTSGVEIRSNNPNQPIAVTTDLKDPSAEPSVVRGSEIVATVFGQVTRVHFMENISDEEAASIIAEQLQQENELAFVTTQETQLSEGIPNVRVGDVRTVVPRGIVLLEKVFSGEYLLTGTRHRIDSANGYDTWATMNMNCLKVPPPPEPSFGSGGGTPVLIYVYPTGFVEGWYITFNSEGYPVKGAYITKAEVEANDYWMSHVRSRTAWFSIGPSQAGGGTLLGNITSAFGYGPSEAGGIPNLGYSTQSISQVPIDWPSGYNMDAIALASPVFDPINNALGVIQEGISDQFADNVALNNEQAAQQDLINQSFASRPGYAAATGVSLGKQLLNMFGN